jgi:hypothetical protein
LREEAGMSSLHPSVIRREPFSDSRGAAADELLVARLRHPTERVAVVACVAASVALLTAGLIILSYAADWLELHPVIEVELDEVRVLAVAAIFAFPLTVFVRRTSRSVARGNGVRVSPANLPVVYGIFREQCRILGVSPEPELYISQQITGSSIAHSVVGERSSILLNAELFDRNFRENLDCIAFAMGGALGSLRLGHTGLWLQLITAYATRVPLINTLALHAWSYSRDRCAAYLVPEGIRGLLIEATGKDMLPNIDVTAFIEQARDFGGFWAWCAGVLQDTPHICDRARALYKAGLFDLDHDLARWGAVKPGVADGIAGS